MNPHFEIRKVQEKLADMKAYYKQITEPKIIHAYGDSEPKRIKEMIAESTTRFDELKKECADTPEPPKAKSVDTANRILITRNHRFYTHDGFCSGNSVKVFESGRFKELKEIPWNYRDTLRGCPDYSRIDATVNEFKKQYPGLEIQNNLIQI